MTHPFLHSIGLAFIATSLLGCDTSTPADPGVSVVVATQTASGAPTPRLLVNLFATLDPCEPEPLSYPFSGADGTANQDTQFAPERPAELSPGFEEEGLLVQCANVAIEVVPSPVPPGDVAGPDTIFAVPVSLRTRRSQPYETAHVEVTLENY